MWGSRWNSYRVTKAKIIIYHTSIYYPMHFSCESLYKNTYRQVYRPHHRDHKLLCNYLSYNIEICDLKYISTILVNTINSKIFKRLSFFQNFFLLFPKNSTMSLAVEVPRAVNNILNWDFWAGNKMRDTL